MTHLKTVLGPGPPEKRYLASWLAVILLLTSLRPLVANDLKDWLAEGAVAYVRWQAIDRLSEDDLSMLFADALPAFEKEWGGATRDQQLTEMGERIAQVAGLSGVGFFLLKTENLPSEAEKVNAMAVLANGRRIYVTRHLVKEMGGYSDLLAGVIGHELAHLARKHVLKGVQDSLKKELAGQVLAEALDANQEIKIGIQTAVSLLELGFSRSQEKQADKIGLGFAAKAGFDPYGLSQALAKIGGDSSRFFSFLSTHPYSKDRVAAAEKEAAKLAAATDQQDESSADQDSAVASHLRAAGAGEEEEPTDDGTVASLLRSAD